MDEQETRCALSVLRNAPGAAPYSMRTDLANTWAIGVGKEFIGCMCTHVAK